MSETVEIATRYVVLTCCTCGIQFGVSAAFERYRREDHTSFYCPSGHGQSFTGETDADRLRKRLHAVTLDKERVEREKQALEATQRQGKCPCCDRTFKQLRAHMMRKHPTYGKAKA